MWLPWIVWLVPLLVGAAAPEHRLFVTFQYDFTIERPCKENQTGNCVKRFIIYDITDPNAPVRLFSIAADPKVKKVQYQVKAQSNLLAISDGMHTLAATAQWANGAESDPRACTTTVAVRPQQVRLNMRMEHGKVE
jgi:hypothetical protein